MLAMANINLQELTTHLDVMDEEINYLDTGAHHQNGVVAEQRIRAVTQPYMDSVPKP
jgi:hypothetical protein